MSAALALAGVLTLSWRTAPDPLRAGPAPIDRYALVTRHNVELSRLDPESPLTVGNRRVRLHGGRDRPADVCRAVREDHSARHAVAVGLAHVSESAAVAHRPVRIAEFDSHGRKAGYADIPGERTPEIEWLRANPHRPAPGPRWVQADARRWLRAQPGDISDVRQTLDLWNGIITSRFRVDGETRRGGDCMPSDDGRSERPRHVAAGRNGTPGDRDPLPVRDGSDDGRRLDEAGRAHDGAHSTADGEARFARTLDGDTYHAAPAGSRAGS